MSSLKKVELCVLIPHYNNYEGLIASLNSLKESIDFDILIIDDGSKDNLPSNLFFSENYPSLNINIIRNSENKGITPTLNQGLEYIRNSSYEFVARLDCGDLCVKDRFSIQYNFLKTNCDFYLIGSHCEYFNPINNKIIAVKKFPSDDKLIRKGMYFNTVFEHPTVMFRVKAIDDLGYYPTDFKVAQDYAYFFKFINRYKCFNIPQILVRKEVSLNSISTKRRKLQVYNRIRTILNNFTPRWYFFAGLTFNLVLFLTPYSLLNSVKKYYYR